MVKWWDAMILLHERYGTDPDLETKPEWFAMTQLQAAWMELVSDYTGAGETEIFEAFEEALPFVKSRATLQHPMTINQAVRILRLIVKDISNQTALRAQYGGAKLPN